MQTLLRFVLCSGCCCEWKWKSWKPAACERVLVAWNTNFSGPVARTTGTTLRAFDSCCISIQSAGCWGQESRFLSLRASGWVHTNWHERALAVTQHKAGFKEGEQSIKHWLVQSYLTVFSILGWAPTQFILGLSVSISGIKSNCGPAWNTKVVNSLAWMFAGCLKTPLEPLFGPWARSVHPYLRHWFPSLLFQNLRSSWQENLFCSKFSSLQSLGSCFLAC